MSKVICSILLWVGVMSLLSACGQSGKLYLPDEPKPVKKGFIIELS